MLKNYIYISKNKLDIYYPQISQGESKETSAKVSVTLGVLKGELSEKVQSETTDETRLQSVIKFLESRGEIGSIDKPKSFFKGEVEARSLIHGQMMFFGAIEKVNDAPVTIGLTCSLRNMLGYSYHEIPNYSQTDIGPLRSEHFVQTSSSLGFARTLRTIWKKEDFFESTNFDAKNELRRRREKYELTDDELVLVKKYKFLNKPILFVHPEGFLAHWVREMILSLFFDPIMRLAFGKKTYKKKINYLHKLTKLKQIDVEKKLQLEDIELLSAIKRTARNIRGPEQRLQFVALRLLEGEIEDEKVLLGSPLYMAWV